MLQTAQEIIKRLPIDPNFDPVLIKKHIKGAEVRHLIPVTGKDFYKHIIENKEQYEELINDHLAEVLAYATLFEALPYIGVKISSGGITVANSNNSDPLEAAERNRLRNTIDQALKEKIQGLREHLEETNYEHYVKKGCGEESMEDTLGIYVE